MEPLAFALGNYGLTKPLKQPGADLGRLNLNFVPVDQIVPMMRRMCRALEFDICEMAFTTYLCSRAAGLPFTAIPVFVTRNFHHWALFYAERSGIRTPKDLEGRRVGVNRGYTVTTGLWARAVLQDEYGVDLDKVTWVPTDEEHVLGFKAPPNVDYSHRGRPMSELLLTGVVDAALGEVGVEAAEIRPLIPNAQEAAHQSFRRTGVYPINHGIVIKNEHLRARPWIADELRALFETAKANYSRDLAGNTANFWDRAAVINAPVVGDPHPFGIEPNRTTLEAIVRHAHAQKMIPRPIPIEDLFVVPP